MKRNVKLMLTGAAIAVASATWLGGAVAADHNDPPARIGGNIDAADIADLYAWHSADAQTLKLVLTFGGPAMPAADQSGNYDADVLYGIHIDSTGDNVANTVIWVRFGQNDLGDWGLQVVGLPGEAGPISGAVETPLTGTTAKVWAGLRDDPFFFDLQGFQDTLQTGTLSFDGTRDSFMGQNVTAVVIEVPVAAAVGGGSNLSIWATTSRI